jgi:hypothetical protein
MAEKTVKKVEGARRAVKQPSLQGYTTHKKTSTLLIQAPAYAKTEFGTQELVREGVTITLNRGFNFIPEKMLEARREVTPELHRWSNEGYLCKGHKDADHMGMVKLTPEYVHSFLQAKVSDARNSVCLWENRKRPAGEKHLEEVISKKNAELEASEDTIAELRALLSANNVEIPSNIQV